MAQVHNGKAEHNVFAFSESPNNLFELMTKDLCLLDLKYKHCDPNRLSSHNLRTFSCNVLLGQSPSVHRYLEMGSIHHHLSFQIGEASQEDVKNFQRVHSFFGAPEHFGEVCIERPAAYLGEPNPFAVEGLSRKLPFEEVESHAFVQLNVA